MAENGCWPYGGAFLHQLGDKARGSRCVDFCSVRVTPIDLIDSDLSEMPAVLVQQALCVSY